MENLSRCGGVNCINCIVTTISRASSVGTSPRAATWHANSGIMGIMDNEFIGPIVRGLAYTTSKFTKIVDWRLAVFFYFCQLACFVGILTSLLLGKTFLAVETPIGFVSSYASAPDAYATLQANTMAGTVSTPCASLVRRRATPLPSPQFSTRSARFPSATISTTRRPPPPR